MPFSLLSFPFLRFVDASGLPLAGAKLYSYEAGTDVPKALHADTTGIHPLTNPAIADASGSLAAYAVDGDSYKLDLFTSLNAHVPGWPVDQVSTVPLVINTFIPRAKGLTTEGDLVTYVAQIGLYVQLGPLVFFTIVVSWTAHNGTGFLVLSDLPHTPRAVPNDLRWMVPTHFSFLPYAPLGQYAGELRGGENFIRIHYLRFADGAEVGETIDSMDTAYVDASGWYLI